MTAKRISLLIITLAFAVTCFARLERWPVRKPAIALAQAEAIGNKTMNDKDFFCIGASFTSMGETQEEWELTYTNEKGALKSIVIDGKGNARLHDHPRDL